MSDARKLKFTSRKSTPNATGEQSDVNFPAGLVNPHFSKSDFHITNLLSKINDVARPNLFKIQIRPPNALYKDWDSVAEGLLVLAKSTKIPSVTIKEYTLERAGMKLPFPTPSYDFGEASITFYCDSNYDLRALFNRWQLWGCSDFITCTSNAPYDVFGGFVNIFQFDYDLVPVYQVTLNHAWPSNISEISLDQDSENSISTFTVDFKYAYQTMAMAGN